MFVISFVAVFALLPVEWCAQVNYCQCGEPTHRGGVPPHRETRHLHHHGSRRRHRTRGSKARSAEFPPRITDHPSDLVVWRNQPATLNCRAEANPEPTIEWYRNGEYVETSNDDQHPQRSLLPGGSLFFYLLKAKSDEGIYTCVARNHLGKALSRNASLYIADLKSDFLLQPTSADVVVGNPLVVECLPPKVHPEPTVTWNKDGVPLNTKNSRVTVVPGKLTINKALKTDSGIYVCVASNQAGVVMESKGAQISVLDPLDTGQADRLKEVRRELAAVHVHLDNITALPNSSVYVHWKVSSPSQFTEGYSVLYRLRSLAESQWMEWISPISTLYSAIIPSLRRGQRYEFKIRPFANKVYGTESNIKHLRIPEEAPDRPPPVTAVEGANGTIIVSWEPPPQGIHSGNIKGYKVWCFGNGSHHQSDWIVDEETKHLEIPSLAAGVKYQIQVAAINEAGIGMRSKSKYVFIETPEVKREKKEEMMSLDFVLQVLRHPAFIATAGSVAWIMLMMAAIYVCQRHSKRYSTKKRNVLGNGLYRFASEDTIIKHRMDTSDSPWLSNTWKSTSCSKNYSSTTSMNSQLLWTDTRDTGEFHKSTMSFERKSEGSRSQIIPLVPDSGKLCSPLYIDLPGKDMKTFQHPSHGKQARPAPYDRAPVPLGMFDQSSFPQLFTVNNNHWYSNPRSNVPRKSMDCLSSNVSLKQPWMHHLKKELHQVNSAPLSPFCPNSSEGVSSPSGHRPEIHQSAKGEYAKVMKTFSSPKLVQYTTSLKVVDLLPFTSLPPPPVPPPHEDPTPETKEGQVPNTSSCSTSNQEKEQKPNNVKAPVPDTLNLNRISTASMAFSMNGDNVLTPEDVAKYLEQGDDIGHNSEFDMSLPRPISTAHTYGYICSPLPSHLVESYQIDDDDDDDLELEDVNSLKSYRKYCETPTSSISEYESSMAGSLVNGWGSVSEDNYTSARCSMVSSSDGSFLMDATFAKELAVAVDSFCFGLSQTESGGTDRLYRDILPSASPLDEVLAGNNQGENVDINIRKPKSNALPVLDWNIDWMDEMEAKYGQKNEMKHHFPFHRKMDPFH
ncbi:roundabout homolog 4 [Pelodytes ibericus]